MCNALEIKPNEHKHKTQDDFEKLVYMLRSGAVLLQFRFAVVITVVHPHTAFVRFLLARTPLTDCTGEWWCIKQMFSVSHRSSHCGEGFADPFSLCRQFASPCVALILQEW